MGHTIPKLGLKKYFNNH